MRHPEGPGITRCAYHNSHAFRALRYDPDVPALPAVPGVLQLKLKHGNTTIGDILSTTYWAYTGSAPSSTALNTMASSVESAWASHLAGLLNTAMNLLEVEITDLSSATGGRGIWTGTTAGTRSGSAIPAGVATLYSLAIARRYRGGKPRMYLPWGVQGDLDGSVAWQPSFTSAALSDWNSFASAVIAAAPSGTTITSQANVSYYKGFTVVTNPVTGRSRNVPTLRATPVVDAVLSVSVNTNYASQRRRNLTV